MNFFATQSKPLKVVVAAGLDDCLRYSDRFCLQERDLNIVHPNQWAELFERGSIDSIVCEHCLEHLTPAESIAVGSHLRL
jgi:predicted SAM-dependent methyltransferase